MNLLLQDDDDEFEDEEGYQSDNKFRASYAEKMLIKNAPDDLKQRLKHSKDSSNAQETMELIKQHLN